MGYDKALFSGAEKRFYERDVSFNKFVNLSEEDIARIDKDIKERFGEVKSKGLDLYGEAIIYLSNPLIHHKYPDVDSRILFLIRLVDKDLSIFREYLSYDIPSIASLQTGDFLDTEDKLRERQAKVNLMISNIRKNLGFFNTRLIGYEAAYFRKFKDNKLFSVSANKNCFDKLVRYSNVGVFRLVDDEGYKRLSDLLAWYLEETNGNSDMFTIAFHILNQNNLFKFKNVGEQVAFLVMAGDSNLDLLRIYEEESKMSEVERRANEEFGFYDSRLLNLEKQYHHRFVPDKMVSIWSKYGV